MCRYCVGVREWSVTIGTDGVKKGGGGGGGRGGLSFVCLCEEFWYEQLQVHVQYMQVEV